MSIEIYTPLGDVDLSQRKIEEYERWNKIVQWGRSNPVRFSEEIFGAQLVDFQRYIFMESWWRQYVLWLCCRGMGKDTLGADMQMTKLMLIPDYHLYISCNAYAQSVDTFNKIRDIALKRIPTFASLTDIFAYEVDKTGTNSDTGFIQSPPAHFRLFNNSGCKALSSNLETIRGKRGAVWFNETGWKDAESLAVVENFANVDSSFSTSTKKVKYISPIQMPLQLLYTSSASSIDTPFFEKYKLFFKKMLVGDSNYFVCDVDAFDILEHSTINGEPIKSHLNEARVAKDMEDDPDAAERELLNKFRRGGGKDALVSMNELMRNSVIRKPLLFNDTGKKKFLFSYDPARNFDNSILAIYEIVEDKHKGTFLRYVNCISMVDTTTKKKTPLNMIQQLDIIREALIAYNGDGVDDFVNIPYFYIDAGAGGGGVSAVADQLLLPWTDSNGITHKGLIDPVHPQYEVARRNELYRDNIPIIRLVNPTIKKEMYDALAKMIKSDLIEFTDYDGKDYVLIENGDGEFEQAMLTNKEKMALVNINLTKTQLSYICRFETANGNVSYELAREKRNKMHDDAAYTACMAGYGLSQMRRKKLLKKPQRDPNDRRLPLMMRQPKLRD